MIEVGRNDPEASVGRLVPKSFGIGYFFYQSLPRIYRGKKVAVKKNDRFPEALRTSLM